MAQRLTELLLERSGRFSETLEATELLDGPLDASRRKETESVASEPPPSPSVEQVQQPSDETPTAGETLPTSTSTAAAEPAPVANDQDEDTLSIAWDSGENELESHLHTWLAGVVALTGGMVTIAAATFVRTILDLRRLDRAARRAGLPVRVPGRTVLDLFEVLRALVRGRDPVGEAKEQILTAVRDRLLRQAATGKVKQHLPQHRSRPLPAPPPTAEEPGQAGGIIGHSSSPPEPPAVLY